MGLTPNASPRGAMTVAGAGRLVRAGVWAQRRIIGGMALKMLGAAATFLVTFIVARTWGAAVSGEYALLAQTVATFGLLAAFGNDQLLVRRTAGSLSEGRRDLARLSYTHAVRLVIFNAALVAGGLLVLTPFAGVIGASSIVMAMAAIGLLFQPLLLVSAAAVRGADRLISSQLLINLPPALMLVGVTGVVFLWPGTPVLGLATVYNVVTVVCGMTAVLVAWRMMRNWPRAAQKHPDDGRTNSNKLGLTIGLDILGSWTALALTGALLGIVEAGVFRVCVQVMTVVAMVPQTFEGMIAPKLARQFRQSDLAGAGSTHVHSIFFLLASAGTPLVLIVAFAEPIMGFFGEEFRVGADALRILALGQLIVLASGPAGAMLTMNGREVISLYLALGAFCVLLATMFLATPLLGIEGAALAVALMWAIRSAGSFLFARRMVRAV